MEKFSRSALSQSGFEGWVSFDGLLDVDPCPRGAGIYVVACPANERPRFNKRSCGGWFKGNDPTVSLEVLTANWVEGAEIIYIGKANDLRRRLREYARFGRGHRIGHWGGRLIWQLENPAVLRVAWKETPELDPSLAEVELIAQFRGHYGKPPFANDPHRLGM